MQIAGDHFLTGTGFTGNENAHIFVSHLLHQLTHLLDFPAGSHQAAEQLYATLLAALLVAAELIPIDLRPVQGVHELGVVQRPLHPCDHSRRIIL